MTIKGSTYNTGDNAKHKAYALEQKKADLQKEAETGPTTPILLCLMMIFLIGGGFCPWLWIGAGIVLATLVGRAIKGCSMTNPAAIEAAQNTTKAVAQQLTAGEQI